MSRLILVAAVLLVPVLPAAAADIEAPPIRYAATAPDNPISRLQKRLDRGAADFRFADDGGYLPAVLKALNVPVSSQVLVFSKTSFQRERIGPKTPRALYFNDDVTVGFCLRGDVLEFTAADPKVGTAFYTLDQDPDQTPKFRRQTETCLTCHGSSRTHGYPGHLVRSVLPDRLGMPVLSAGSKQTDHASPFAERWGGWYVTGTHGDQPHMGNRVVQNPRRPEDDDGTGLNVTDLRPRFTVGNYLSPHSDLVALMVLEHQLEGHNRIVRAALQTREALHHETELNRELKEPAGKRWEGTTRRIRAACEPLVEYLLFSGEAKLTAPVVGTSAFAEEFAARGPFDKQGRSLRQFDLNTRLFRFPCSYLVYTEAFAALPPEARGYVFDRLGKVLAGDDTSAPFAHLSAADRKAVREILAATLPGAPAAWRE